MLALLSIKAGGGNQLASLGNSADVQTRLKWQIGQIANLIIKLNICQVGG